MSVYKPIAALMAVACAVLSATARADDDAAALRAELAEPEIGLRRAGRRTRIAHRATGSRVDRGRTRTRAGGGHDCTFRGQ